MIIQPATAIDEMHARLDTLDRDTARAEADRAHLTERIKRNQHLAADYQRLIDYIELEQP